MATAADDAWPDIRVVHVAGQPDRAAARRAIRAALHDALAAWSGLPPGRIVLHADPGIAPYALLQSGDGADARRVGLAISHDGALSVAAFNPHGALGIDVMRFDDVPDWQAVARDYLGPAVANALAALPAPARAAAFARAWSAHEARLKCLGLGLAEWDAVPADRLAACRCRPLAVPAGYAGHIALPPLG